MLLSSLHSLWNSSNSIRPLWSLSYLISMFLALSVSISMSISLSASRSSLWSSLPLWLVSYLSNDTRIHALASSLAMSSFTAFRAGAAAAVAAATTGSVPTALRDCWPRRMDCILVAASAASFASRAASALAALAAFSASALAAASLALASFISAFSAAFLASASPALSSPSALEPRPGLMAPRPSCTLALVPSIDFLIGCTTCLSVGFTILSWKKSLVPLTTAPPRFFALSPIPATAFFALEAVSPTAFTAPAAALDAAAATAPCSDAFALCRHSPMNWSIIGLYVRSNAAASSAIFCSAALAAACTAAAFSTTAFSAAAFSAAADAALAAAAFTAAAFSAAAITAACSFAACSAAALSAAATCLSTPADLLLPKNPAFAAFTSRGFLASTLINMSPEAALMILAAWLWLVTAMLLISSTMSPLTIWSAETDPGWTLPIRGWPVSPS
mmetsp:Transcript_39985/g.95704  ORF Transcript_39985/g.95704 Transcript_39985/m.95704 type:complete len:448 (-) Transcript_39985:122-1465(-)